ncbi:hypothetical protein [Thermostichus vulcanus]|uniref:Uncharacterized protein n=1 Tax=Thermostichus vulcanus str. 'Rupite' TaxID=2813851 RepID=A0ABT0C879_THEVL|nr:hypothetical protein [Thermostichus vulcanus]MCJ2541961.1 hypothetical protein [Thermostichus vulcanus str. 'Rupite']
MGSGEAVQTTVLSRERVGELDCRTDMAQGLQVVESSDHGFHQTPPVRIRQ